MLRTSVRSRKKVICAVVNEKTDGLVFIQELIEAGKIRAIIDRCFPWEQAVAAHRYADKGPQTGSAAITMGPGDKTKSN
jgi:NADPH:quinone reductase-like Zn-dependent oxidoreductase